MRTGPIISSVVLACVFLLAQNAVAAEKPKSDAYKAYTEQVVTIAVHAVRTELDKQSSPPSDILLHFKFQVDPAGRVHNIKITGNSPNQSVQETARRALADLKLPRFPPNVADEAGRNWIDITMPFVIGHFNSEDKSTKRDSPDTVAYLMRCNEIIMSMLDAEAVKHRGDLNATLEIILLLDPKGHVRAQKIIATPPVQWLNQMGQKVVRDAKLPAMPSQVVAEHKGDLVPFATRWVYERKG